MEFVSGVRLIEGRIGEPFFHRLSDELIASVQPLQKSLFGVGEVCNHICKKTVWYAY